MPYNIYKIPYNIYKILYQNIYKMPYKDYMNTIIPSSPFCVPFVS